MRGLLRNKPTVGAWHGAYGHGRISATPTSGARMLNPVQPAGRLLMSSRKSCSLQTMAGVATPVAVLRDLPAAVRVGPSLSLSVRIQRVVAAVEEAAKDVRLVTLAQSSKVRELELRFMLRPQLKVRAWPYLWSETISTVKNMTTVS